MKQVMVAPSILSANFGNLEKDFDFLNRSEADWIHVDIMDGNFVPNISFGFPLLSAMKKLSKKPLDVHLMINQPERYFSRFRDAGADSLSIHIEKSESLLYSANRVISSLSQIKELGMKAAVAFNPRTPVEAIKDVIPIVDYVLLMSVVPGYGGQAFIP